MKVILRGSRWGMIGEVLILIYYFGPGLIIAASHIRGIAALLVLLAFNALVFLPFAALMGAVTGWLIDWLSNRTAREIGVLFSIVFGAVVVGAVGWLIGLFLIYNRYSTYDEVQRSIVGPMRYFNGLLIIGSVIGATSGLGIGLFYRRRFSESVG